MVQIHMQDDWRVWDNTEAVEIVSVRTAGDQTATVRNVKRHTTSSRELFASGGVYKFGDQVFSIPAPLLPENFVPKLRDRIIDDHEQVYTVLDVDERKRDANGVVQTYRVRARNLVLAYELRDKITIERPVMVLDDTGAEKMIRWDPLFKDIPAKVELVSATLADERGLRGLKRTFQVFLDRELPGYDSALQLLSVKDRIVWGDTPSGYLDIVGYHNFDDINELPVIDAEQGP